MNSRRAQYLTMLGHIAADINQGALPALLPFLIAEHGFSYAEAALFVLASNIVSAVIQPLFGWMGDRFSKPWFMAAGVIVASVGFALIGFVDSYPVMLVCACISGIGIALFHPEGGRLANLASGQTKGKGISVFSVGGNLGFALGPIIVVAGMALFGIHGTILTLITGAIASFLLLSHNKMLSDLSDAETYNAVQSGEKDDLKGFVLALIPVFTRSIVYFALITFIPLFLVNVLKTSKSLSSLAITFFALVGVAGTLTGGPLGDRVGHVKVMVIGYLLLAPATLLFAFNRYIPIALLIMAVLAFLITMITPCSTVTTQRFLPQHLGTASGITFGVAASVGGVISPLLGAVGDSFGLPISMMIVAGVSAIGSAATLTVPKENRQIDEDS